ncbi:MAG TPA: hypothetical protein VGA51_15890 [Casimicrobiaceae bacterium]
MRAILLAVAALFLAGCASAPANTTAVYDHKYNTYSFAKNSSQSEFVGTSAAADVKARPSWYKFGHP